MQSKHDKFVYILIDNDNVLSSNSSFLFQLQKGINNTIQINIRLRLAPYAGFFVRNRFTAAIH